MSNDSFKYKIYNKYIKRLLIEYKNHNIGFFYILKNLEIDDIKITTDNDFEEAYDSIYLKKIQVHTLTFLLTEESFDYISISDQEGVSEVIRTDLLQIIKENESGEYIKKIKLELKDEGLYKKLLSKEAESFLIEASDSNHKIDTNDYLENKIKSVEITDFWDKDCLRVFISHSVKNYNIAKKLKELLLDSGISCFVAHKDIKPTTKWQKEIKKALNSMELFLAIVTEDFNNSYWTNQEIGFALCKGIPIISIKMDEAPPPGFIFEEQAITLSEKDIVYYHAERFSELLKLIEEKFPKHPFIKKKFLSAKDSSFDLVKESFMKIIYLKFNDTEIETIIKEIKDAKNQSRNWGGINQLSVLLWDNIGSDHLSQLPENERDKYKYYAELLNDKILSQHTQKRYSIKKSNNYFEIIDNQVIFPKIQKVTEKQKIDDLPF